MTAAPHRQIFQRAPALRDLVPFVHLADLPTPVDQVDDGLWVKRDDLTSSVYGGNKVRKLEFVLGAPARRRHRLLTAGGMGSHHVEAVATHGARLGLVTEAVIYGVEVVDDPAAALARLEDLAVRIHRVGSEYLMPLALARRLRRGVHLVMPGASTPLGALGYVEAGLELAQQMPPAADCVVTALGSGGTAVGLALGLAWGGCDAEVLAPLVSSPLVANRVVLSALEAGTRALLATGGVAPPRTRLRALTGYVGPGYGQSSEEGTRAAREAEALGVAVERTYTAKAFAAALDARRRGRHVVFVQTWAGPREPAAR